MKALIIVTLLFTGCAQMKFSHATKDEAKRKQDWTNCHAKMGQANISSALYGAHQRDFMQMCMEGEGWERQ